MHITVISFFLCLQVETTVTTHKVVTVQPHAEASSKPEPTRKEEPKKQVPKAQSVDQSSEKQAKPKSTVNVVVVPTQEDFSTLVAKPLGDPFPQDKLEAAFPETESKPHIVKYIAPIRCGSQREFYVNACDNHHPYRTWTVVSTS